MAVTILLSAITYQLTSTKYIKAIITGSAVINIMLPTSVLSPSISTPHRIFQITSQLAPLSSIMILIAL